MEEQAVGVDNSAELTINDKLYFAVVVNDSQSVNFIEGSKFVPFNSTTKIPFFLAGSSNAVTPAASTPWYSHIPGITTPAIPATTIPEIPTYAHGVLQAQVSKLTEVDLKEFPNGVKVTLTEEIATGKFNFKTQPSI